MSIREATGGRGLLCPISLFTARWGRTWCDQPQTWPPISGLISESEELRRRICATDSHRRRTTQRDSIQTNRANAFRAEHAIRDGDLVKLKLEVGRNAGAHVVVAAARLPVGVGVRGRGRPLAGGGARGALGGRFGLPERVGLPHRGGGRPPAARVGRVGRGPDGGRRLDLLRPGGAPRPRAVGVVPRGGQGGALRAARRRRAATAPSASSSSSLGTRCAPRGSPCTTRIGSRSRRGCTRR